MPLLQDGDVWLDDQMHQHAGRTVTFVRGQHETASFTAVATEKVYEVIGRDGFAMHIESRDYHLPAASVLVNGSAVEPRNGDRIKETIGGVLQTFEVVPMGSDKPAAEARSDGARWLVHTKRV